MENKYDEIENDSKELCFDDYAIIQDVVDNNIHEVDRYYRLETIAKASLAVSALAICGLVGASITSLAGAEVKDVVYEAYSYASFFGLAGMFTTVGVAKNLESHFRDCIAAKIANDETTNDFDRYTHINRLSDKMIEMIDAGEIKHGCIMEDAENNVTKVDANSEVDKTSDDDELQR